MAQAPTVSVVIPAFQRAGSIGRAVDSALRQTAADLEVIVVDDGSRDGTADVVRGIADPRVRLIEHATNRGGNAARQTGIDAARGRWVAFLDSDDLWLPGKLDKQLARLQDAGPDYGFCYTWFETHLADGCVLPPREVHAEGVRNGEFVTHQAVGTFSTIVISRAVLTAIGGLDVTLPACQDWDLVLRANRVTGLCVVPEVLARYHHAESDPHRITTRKASVVRGHRKIYRQLRVDYPHLPPQEVEASRRYVMEVLARHGAVGDVLRIACDGSNRTMSAANARFAGHMVVRAARKRWQHAGSASRQVPSRGAA